MAKLYSILLIVVLALITQPRWESEAAGIHYFDQYIPNQTRRRFNCCSTSILRGGGGDKHSSSRSKHSEPTADAAKASIEPDKLVMTPVENEVDGSAQQDAVPEEEERFGYLKIAEKEIREAEVKEAKRNKEIDEYFEKRERGEIKLPEEQVGGRVFE